MKYKLFKNDDVLVEKSAIEELNKLLNITQTIDILKNQNFLNQNSALHEVINTPDFHKGSGVPIGTVMLTEGFVIPQAVGNDINCGMRLYVTSLTEEKVIENYNKINKNIRHIFFEGGRNIPMCKVQREAIFSNGLTGIFETHKHANNQGLWQHYDVKQQEMDLLSVDNKGSLKTDIPEELSVLIGSDTLSYDNQIGSIGGGNHFVELQRVDNVFDKETAHAWGIKDNQIVVMIHTGSVAVGQHNGFLTKEMLKNIYPKNIKHPENGVYLLPETAQYAKEWEMFWSYMNSAANFAFANRMFIGLMLYKSISDIVGEFEYKLLYDTPHNLIWKQTLDNKQYYMHRKGACPARGMMEMQNTKFAYYGEPVFIPGSMGSSSYVLKGMGNREALFSASHGAGRSLSRSDALKIKTNDFNNFINKFKIITPVDITRPDLKGRTDIIKKWEEEVKAEAPFAYKDVTPIIQTHIDNNMASSVAKLTPIFTIKS